MEEKTYTLTLRQTGTYEYEVIVPEISATKIAPTLDSALTITVHDILKHFTARYLILVFADHHADRNSRSVAPQVRPQAEPELQAAFEVAQLGIAPRVKRSLYHLIFELSRPLTREQFTWLNAHAGKLFDRYYIIDELAVQFDALAEESWRQPEGCGHE